MVERQAGRQLVQIPGAVGLALPARWKASSSAARQQRIVERAGEVKDSFERRHRLRDFTERLLDVLATRQVGANEPRVERAQDFLVRGGRLAAPQQHDFPGAVVGELDASRRPSPPAARHEIRCVIVEPDRPVADDSRLSRAMRAT